MKPMLKRVIFALRDFFVVAVAFSLLAYVVLLHGDAFYVLQPGIKELMAVLTFIGGIVLAIMVAVEKDAQRKAQYEADA